MEPERPSPKLAILTEDTFAAVVRMFMSPANQKWHLPHDKGGYADETKRGWRRALEFAARPDCLGALSRYEIIPTLFRSSSINLQIDRASNVRFWGRSGNWRSGRSSAATCRTPSPSASKSPNRTTTVGHTPWTDEQVAYGETHARPDLAKVITLGANTGQRGSDLVRMGPTDIENYNGREGIKVIQQKTGRVIWIPILTPLEKAMATWPRGRGRSCGARTAFP